MVDVVFSGLDGASERDVALTSSADALVSDVVEALTGRDGTAAALVIDGRVHSRDVPMRDVVLPRGSVVAVTAGAALAGRGLGSAPTTAVAAPPLPSLAVVEVRVIAGLDAGQRFLLPPGHFVVGRAGADGVDVPLVSDTVSARHAALTDRGSRLAQRCARRAGVHPS
jgi:hypothetical protein